MHARYTVYCILYTVYCILYTVYSIQYTVYSIQYSVHARRYSASLEKQEKHNALSVHILCVRHVAITQPGQEAVPQVPSLVPSYL